MPLAFILTFLLFIEMSGCAYRHHDHISGIDHIWGIGHFTQKSQVSSFHQEAVLHGAEVVGMSFGKSANGPYLTIGWENRQELQVLATDTAVQLVGPPREISSTRLISDWSTMSFVKESK